MSRPVKIVFLILQFVIAALVIAFCVHLYINGGFTFGSLIASGDTDHVMTTAIHTLLLLLFGLVFFIVFGKATYPEVSFIIIAASFMQLMNLRVFLIPLDHLTIDTSILIQRGYYALWFFSMSLIFCSGLFHNGVSYLKQNLFILISLCVTVIVMVIIPIPSGLETLYDYMEISSMKGFIALLGAASVLNYIIASIRNNSKTFTLIALGLLLFLGGNILLLYLATPLYLGIAAALFIIGSSIMIREFYMLHLWS